LKKKEAGVSIDEEFFIFSLIYLGIPWMTGDLCLRQTLLPLCLIL